MTRDDYAEKARAVFLAAVMVLSVVAMSAAFAGSGAAVSQSDTDGLADGEGYIVADPANANQSATHTIQVQPGSDLGNLSDPAASNLTVTYNNSVDFSSVSNVSGAVNSGNNISEGLAGLNIYVNDTNVQYANVTFSDVNDKVDINVTENINVSSSDVVTLELGVNTESIGNPSESSTEVDVSVAGGSGTANFDSSNNNALSLAMGEGPIEVDQGSDTFYWNTFYRGVQNASSSGHTVTVTEDLDETIPTADNATVKSSGVTIQGQNNPEINVSGLAGDVINVSTQTNLTIDGLTIEGDGLSRPVINGTTGVGTTNITISNNNFQNITGTTIKLEGENSNGNSDTIEISDNTFTGEQGVTIEVNPADYSDEGDTITIDSNDITRDSGGNNVIDIPSSGGSSAQIDITGGTIEGDAGSTDTGIRLNTDHDVDVEDVSINATDTGIDVTYGNGEFLNVTNVDLTNVDSTGVDISNNKNVKIDSVTISDSNDDTSDATAVNLADTSNDPEIVNATISDVDVGVDIDDGSGTQAYVNKSTITGSNTSIDLQVDIDLDLYENDIENNDYGLNVSNKNPAVTLRDNNFDGNSQAALYIDANNNDTDARENYWGDADGPSDLGFGSGDAVTNTTGTTITDLVIYPYYNDTVGSDSATLKPDSTPDVEQAIVGDKETVTVSTDGHVGPSQQAYVFDPADGSVAVKSTDSAGTFIYTNTFTSTGDYNAFVNYTTADGIELGQSVNATTQVQYDVDVTFSDQDLVYDRAGDFVVADVTAKNANADAVSDIKIGLYRPSDYDTESGEVTDLSSSVQNETTESNGEASFSNLADDAGTWVVANATEGDVIYDTITVEPQSAEVSITSNASNNAGFGQEYTIKVFDAEGNTFDFQNGTDPGTGDYDGYLNITGPFTDDITEGDVDGDLEYDPPSSPEFIHIDEPATNATGAFVVNLTATPSTNASEIGVSLENGGTNNGMEDTDNADSPESPDIKGSDALPVQDSDEDLIVDRETTDIKVTGNADQEIKINVVGGDNKAPNNSTDSRLDNATVSIDGSGVGIEDDSVLLNGSNAGNPATFSSLDPDQAGTIDVNVEADTNSSETVTETVIVNVTGDQFDNLSPTSVTIDEEADVSVDVTDVDGNAELARNVSFNATSDVFNATDAGVTGSTLNISSIENVIAIDGTEVATFGTGDSTYLAENITFDTTGTINLTVVDSSGDIRVSADDVIDVQGAEVFDVSTDESPFLTGLNETVNFTISEDGTRLNGTDLKDSIDIASTEVMQNGTSITTGSGPSFVNTTADLGGKDAIRVALNANQSATAQVNVSVQDAPNDRTGESSFDVVEPDVSADLSGDLTAGLTDEFDITVEDPRDGSGLGGATVNITAANGTYTVENTTDGGSSITLTSDGEDGELETDENGTVAVSVETGALTNSSAGLDIQTKLDADERFGDARVDAGNQTLKEFSDGGFQDLTDPIPFDNSEKVFYQLRDANGDTLSGRTVEVNASGSSAATFTTDSQGFIEVNYSSSAIDLDPGGTVDYDVQNDANGLLTLNTVNVTEDKEEVQLTLTVESSSSVKQGDNLNFTVTREDRPASIQETNATLEFTNASGDVVDTFNTGSVDDADYGIVNTSDLEPGDYTVNATRSDEGDKTFLTGSATVTVESEPTPTGPLNVTADPGETGLNNFTFTFNASQIDAGDDVINLGIMFGDQSGVNASAIEAEDISIVGDNIGTTGLASISSATNATLIGPVSDNFVLGNEDGSITVTIDGVDVPESGEFDATLGFLDDSTEEIAVGEDTYTITEGDTEQAVFNVSNLDPATTTVQQGDEIDVSATVTNTGSVGATQNVTLTIGNTTRTESVQLTAGANTTVTFENVSTAAIDAPATVTHTVASDDDSVSGTLTVERGLATYTDENGDTSTSQLRDAIDDWRNGDISTELLRDVIANWRQS